MKKIIKNICLFSIMLCLSLMFIDNAQAKLCKDFDPKTECVGAIDDNGDECMQYGNGTSGITKCVPKNCWAYNQASVYGQDFEKQNEDGKVHLIGCENDDRCMVYGSSCINKNAYPRVTCEDYGISITLNGSISTCPPNDYWYNECGTTIDPNNDTRWLCKTTQVVEKQKECTNYTKKEECDSHELDEYNNRCAWNKETNTCDIVLYQSDIDAAATAGTVTGAGREDAAEEKLKEISKDSSIKKTCRLFTVDDCPKSPATDDYGYECHVIGDLSISAGYLTCARKNVVIVKKPFKCSDVKYLTSIWTFIRIVAPFIIVLFGSLDFFKSMVAGDEKKMKEARGKFIKRLIAFGLLILLPFIVQFIFANMGTYGSDNICLVKCIATNDTSEKGCD